MHYDPATGLFTSIKRRKRCHVGSVLGTVVDDGYLVASLDNRLYRLHRLAWLLMTGTWPKDQIDHRNRIRTDNRWCNLREATNAENGHNALREPGHTGIRGTTETRGGKFYAQIKAGGKQRYLGTFATAEEAGKVYAEAKLELHPFAEA